MTSDLKGLPPNCCKCPVTVLCLTYYMLHFANLPSKFRHTSSEYWQSKFCHTEYWHAWRSSARLPNLDPYSCIVSVLTIFSGDILWYSISQILDRWFRHPGQFISKVLLVNASWCMSGVCGLGGWVEGGQIQHHFSHS